ncbi:MAG: 3-phosphoserine/phosphohydroxythreonine transaminase [Candidatus Margulisbacteria bacterium]|nr:3-phosphoserine/phosphohydroxythreonine transaminase [Candidatus Margulisiibacteriota bacterium]
MLKGRCHNFNAGPAVLPESVLLEAQAEFVNFRHSGMSILEMSHRSKLFEDLLAETETNLRQLLGISDDYSVLFLQGGASLQFSMVPQNLALKDRPMDVVLTGNWTQKAVKEMKRFGEVRVVATSEAGQFRYIPSVSESDFDRNASFAYLTSNNTIYGSQFHEFPDTGLVPLVADMSSDILSRPLDVSKFGLIFAGAQKNAGPSGVTLVIIRKDLLERCDTSVPTMLQYRTHAENHSLYNTIPTFGVYMVGLVLKWIRSQGGLAAMAVANQAKATLLYDAIDQSAFFYCPVREDARSLMNIVFRIQGDNDALESKFVSEAQKVGIVGIKGHRLIGGLRASTYNALPIESVKALIDFMRDFEKANS